jgi:hypothetical protein
MFPALVAALSKKCCLDRDDEHRRKVTLEAPKVIQIAGVDDASAA